MSSVSGGAGTASVSGSDCREVILYEECPASDMSLAALDDLGDELGLPRHEHHRISMRAILRSIQHMIRRD